MFSLVFFPLLLYDLDIPLCVGRTATSPNLSGLPLCRERPSHVSCLRTWGSIKPFGQMYVLCSFMHKLQQVGSIDCFSSGAHKLLSLVSVHCTAVTLCGSVCSPPSSFPHRISLESLAAWNSVSRPGWPGNHRDPSTLLPGARIKGVYPNPDATFCCYCSESFSGI